MTEPTGQSKEPATHLFAKLFADAWRHKKIAKARELGGDAAVAMWAMALAMSRDGALDGRVTGPLLRHLTAAKDPRRVAAALVLADLWVAAPDEPDAWDIHDYEDRAGTNAQIRGGRSAPPVEMSAQERRRVADKERKAAARRADKADALADMSAAQSRQRPPSSAVRPPPGTDLSASRASDPEEKDGEQEKNLPDEKRARADMGTRGLVSEAAETTLRNVYADAVTAVVGSPCAPVSGTPERQELATLVGVFAAGRVGDDLARWLREVVTEYVIAKKRDARFERGFAPSKCIEWLNAGRPSSTAAPSRSGQPRPQPGATNWLEKAELLK